MSYDYDPVEETVRISFNGRSAYVPLNEIAQEDLDLLLLLSSREGIEIWDNTYGLHAMAKVADRILDHGDSVSASTFIMPPPSWHICYDITVPKRCRNEYLLMGKDDMVALKLSGAFSAPSNVAVTKIKSEIGLDDIPAFTHYIACVSERYAYFKSGGETWHNGKNKRKRSTAAKCNKDSKIVNEKTG